MITLFPEIFQGSLDASILGRARREGKVEIVVHHMREWGDGPHRYLDDPPYGGGPGMLLKPGPLCRALDDVCNDDTFVIAMTPAGHLFNRDRVVQLAEMDHLCILCGRYEGFDQRIVDSRVDLELSIGDYVLTGGEIPALAVIDAVVRRFPGVVGNDRAVAEDSFETGLLEAPHYTRPAVFEGMPVPDVLKSGHHAAIEQWRLTESLRRTAERRPDLLADRDLPAAWQKILAGLADPSESQ